MRRLYHQISARGVQFSIVEKFDNVAKSGMSAVQLVLLTIANLANPISINDKTHGIRYKYTHYSFLPLYV
jgi:hypothetical protein